MAILAATAEIARITAIKTPKAPAAPDPKETAAAQTGTNVATAVANSWLGNVNQNTPDGSLKYSQTGTYKFTDPTTGKTYDLPTMTATTTLSDMQQKIKDQEDAASLNLGTIANQQSAKIGGLLGTSLDVSKLPTAGKAPTYTQFQSGPQLATTFGDAGAITKTYGDAGGYEAGRQKVEDAMFSRLNPQIDQARSAEETRLQNQGVRIGSTAWENAMSDFNKGVNDQRTSVVLAGGQEQSRLAGLDQAKATFENSAQGQNYNQLLGRADFSNNGLQTMFGNDMATTQANNDLQDRSFANSNTARQNALQEATAIRQMPINEISALMSGSQVQQPNFVSTNMPTIPTTDYAGLVQSNYQNRMAAYQQQQASRNSMIGGLFSLGSSAIRASDRRLKTDVRHVGTGPLGLAVYSFRYIWGGPVRLGVMAQDVLRVMPEAVLRMASGYLAVDYGKLFAREAA